MRLTQLFIAAAFSAVAAFSADQALINLVMPDARVIAGIDIERARNTALGKKMIAGMHLNDGDMAKFSAATGFDPRRDLREVIFASTDAKGSKDNGLMIIRGVFDLPKINAFMSVSGLVATEKINGIDLFSKAKEEGGFAFVDSSMAVAGDKNSVRAALQRRSANSATLGGDTYAKVQTMSRGNDLWLVSSVPVSELSDKLNEATGSDPTGGMMKGDVLKSIEQAAVGIRVAADLLELTAEAVAHTEKDATALADVVRFLTTMVQMGRDKPEVAALATALDSMKLTTTARTTKINLTIPAAEFEKMIDNKKSLPAPARI